MGWPDGSINAIAANRVRWAVVQGFLGESVIFGRCGLLPDVGHALRIITAEDARCRLAAEVAVNAGLIHVEWAGDVPWCFVYSVSHGCLLVRHDGARCRMLQEIHKPNRLMLFVNQYLATVPFDLYELHLLQLVARHGSFTRAAAQAGLTQSAITRQVQGVESRLGLALFERTTRRVTVTAAGSFLLHEGARLVGDLDALLVRLREQFTDVPKEVRVGVSQTIGFSYLPGLFVAQRKRRPDVRLRVVHQPSRVLFAQLDANEIDLAILCPPRRLPPTVRVTHRFDDAFALIVPPGLTPPTPRPSRQPTRWREWLHAQEWLLIHDTSHTGTRLRAWMRQRGWHTPHATQLDSFDLIINLVALGQGVSLVPQRALALYVRRRKVQRFETSEKFTREITVLTRRHPRPPAHVAEFVENILF